MIGRQVKLRDGRSALKRTIFNFSDLIVAEVSARQTAISKETFAIVSLKHMSECGSGVCSYIFFSCVRDLNAPLASREVISLLFRRLQGQQRETKLKKKQNNNNQQTDNGRYKAR